MVEEEPENEWAEREAAWSAVVGPSFAPLIGVDPSSLAPLDIGVDERPAAEMVFERRNLGLGTEQPIWPPSPGLLDPEWMRSDRALWTSDQWRLHSEWLERRGYGLVAELGRARTEKLQSDRKRWRGKKAEPQYPSGLLSRFETRGKPGRPRGSEKTEIAARANALQLSMSKELDRTVTAVQALTELYRREGRPAFRATHDRSVLTAMSKLKRSKSQ